MLLVLVLVDRLHAPWATLGFLLGALLGRERLADTWLLLTGRLAGVRFLIVRYGRGRLLWDGRIAGVPVEIGLWPNSLYLYFALVPGPALRLRLWLSSACYFGVHAGLGGWLALSADGLGRGVGIGLLLTVVLRLPRPDTSPLVSGWALLVMPFRADWLGQHLWKPEAVQADRLLSTGRIAEARALLEGLEPGEYPLAHLTPAGLALVEGRYEEAEQIAADVADRGYAFHTAHLLIGMAFIGRADSGEFSPSAQGRCWIRSSSGWA
ncbi:hypothetical protein ACFQ0M_29300 [Kitasatospora aburaviensis]